jgi:hypothetical protein
LALYLRGYKKPILLNKNAIDSLAREFKETNWELWLRKEVTLTTSEEDISVKAAIKYEAPAPKPRDASKISGAIADLLASAISTPHDRANTSKILHEVADLLLHAH